MKKIAIIGGGISGLSAAYTLEKARLAGSPLEYRLFEASPRLGGVLLTEHVAGCVVEAGPDSFLTEKSWAVDFCREIGLGDQLITSKDSIRKTYIYLKGQLIPMPDGLAFMVPTKIWPIVFSPLFSLNTKMRMAREWLSSSPSAQNGEPGSGPNDESVADFITRHYGREMVDRLADPLLSGVYGGSASELSVRAVLPRFVEMEAKFGSLSKGMVSARKKALNSSSPPVFTSLRGGMQQMADAVAEKIPPSSLRTNTRIDSLRCESGQWTISTNGESERFGAVVLAAPAHAAASMLQISSPDLAKELREIPYSSSVTVAMGFDQTSLASLPTGFGFLVPRSENKNIMAVTFVHQKFPGRAPAGMGLLRCFLGGTHNDQLLALNEDAIQKIVREELRQNLGLDAEPLFTGIFKWKNAMAQYTVGYARRMENIQRLAAQIPCFALAGNAYSGIGVPDCIRSGQNAAQQVLTALSR
ncbi:MAG TPA: protoporphyrinogen oxidase [Terriglobales bacterium]|jgi:oxygen-dependent protoporphyrinogen oxidase